MMPILNVAQASKHIREGWAKYQQGKWYINEGEDDMRPATQWEVRWLDQAQEVLDVWDATPLDLRLMAKTLMTKEMWEVLGE